MRTCVGRRAGSSARPGGRSCRRRPSSRRQCPPRGRRRAPGSSTARPRQAEAAAAGRSAAAWAGPMGRRALSDPLGEGVGPPGGGSGGDRTDGGAGGLRGDRRALQRRWTASGTATIVTSSTSRSAWIPREPARRPGSAIACNQPRRAALRTPVARRSTVEEQVVDEALESVTLERRPGFVERAEKRSGTTPDAERVVDRPTRATGREREARVGRVSPQEADRASERTVARGVNSSLVAREVAASSADDPARIRARASTNGVEPSLR